MTEKTIFSQTLNQEVTFKKGKAWGYAAVCADGVVYTPEETRLYTSSGVDICIEEHLIKKVFGGTITQVRSTK